MQRGVESFDFLTSDVARPGLLQSEPAQTMQSLLKISVEFEPDVVAQLIQKLRCDYDYSGSAANIALIQKRQRKRHGAEDPSSYRT